MSTTTPHRVGEPLDLGDRPRLEDEGPAVLRKLRTVVARVLGATGWRGGSSAELSRLLGLDRSLGWKVWSLAEGEGSIPSPQHVPGRGGVEKFLAAAGVAGAPTDLVNQARGTFARYRELALEHGSDRASADILLGNLSPEGRERQDLALRRGLFRGNSRVLGTQVGMLYQCSAVFPGPAGCFPSVALVRGYYGMRTMRPGVWWVLSRSTVIQSHGPVASRRVTLDGEGVGAEAAPVLDEFCRPGSLRVRRRVVQGGTVQDELEPRPMGRAGAVDVVLGEMVTHIPTDAAERDGVTMSVRVPAESLCFDVLLHDGATGQRPLVECYTLVNTEFPYQDLEHRDLIPMTEELADLGSAAGIAGLPDVPEHAALLERLIGATGRPASEFRAYRLRMRFPPVPICLVVTYAVGGRGGSQI